MHSTGSFFMRTANTLIRLGGCPGLSECSLGVQRFLTNPPTSLIVLKDVGKTTLSLIKTVGYLNYYLKYKLMQGKKGNLEKDEHSTW